MGGVNQAAQSQEQANQAKAQQYAAAQQQAAIAAINAWQKANPSPNSQAAPLQPPGASSPATIGGGTAPGSAQPQAAAMHPPTGAPAQPQPGQPAQAAPAAGATAQPQPSFANLSPQQKQMLMAKLGGQTAPVAAPAQTAQMKAL